MCDNRTIELKVGWPFRLEPTNRKSFTEYGRFLACVWMVILGEVGQPCIPATDADLAGVHTHRLARKRFKENVE